MNGLEPPLEYLLTLSQPLLELGYVHGSLGATIQEHT
jgi:hypothetical protein